MYMYCTCIIIYILCKCLLSTYITVITEYGWRRENGKLEIVWEVLENIQKAKASLDFVLTDCKCKTGCTTRICSCRKKERECGPSCSCQFCKNMNTPTHMCSASDETDLVVQDLLEEKDDETYIADSDDDLDDWRREEMDDDQELKALMEFVFGCEIMKSTKPSACSSRDALPIIVAEYRIKYGIPVSGCVTYTIITNAHRAALIDGLGYAPWSAT